VKACDPDVALKLAGGGPEACYRKPAVRRNEVGQLAVSAGNPAAPEVRRPGQAVFFSIRADALRGDLADVTNMRGLRFAETTSGP
jgi:hypothetical protein